MAEPSRLAWRSELGWSARSPADRADPQSGLVVHYDGSDQGLASENHAACVDYWNWARDFHTNSRGWVDVGYCVDEETEILTEDGWRTFRGVAEGDLVLTLDHENGMSRWQPVQAVNIFPAMPRELIRMAGKSHSSLTTAAHRWPVERFSRRTEPQRRKGADGTWAATGRAEHTRQGCERVWTTTEDLTYWDRVPLSAPCADLPTEPKWADAWVELVAWFWTEGHITAQPGVVIHQSEQQSSANVVRIRSVLHACLGPPCDSFPRTGAAADDVPRWREVRDRPLVEFHLSGDAGRVLTEAAPDRVPSHAFLRSLTRAQLGLFIEVSLLAGGHTSRTVSAKALSQQNRQAAEAFQFAAILAGHATSLRHQPPTASTSSDTWQIELRREGHLAPKAAAMRKSEFRITREPYEGRVWCPTTPNGTWLARRNGTVYFTGNSFMACPHGYVMEGRGLYRYQAAQGTTSGNSNYYSVTLACGPGDPIPDAQVQAVRELRAWLMEPGTSIAGSVLGHRDFTWTSCPGDTAYRMVQDGTFERAPGARIPGAGTDTTEEEPLIGLSKGDTGEAVTALQALITYVDSSLLSEHGIDGHYGSETAAGLLAVRASVGSAAEPGWGDTVTGYAYAQLMRAVARAEARA